MKQARIERDAERFAQVVQRYLYTDAGLAALRELAHLRYRTGQRQRAAFCYAKLIEHLGPARWTTEDLSQATIAFARQGNRVQANWTRKQLLSRRKLTAEEMPKDLASERQTEGWPVYRGNAERSAEGDGGPPFLVPLWRKSMLFDEEKDNPEPARRIRLAEKWFREHHQSIIPTFSPITVTVSRGGQKIPLLIYRNYWGIVARILKKSTQGGMPLPEGEVAWGSPSNWSLERLLHSRSDSRKSQPMDEWLDFYLAPNNQRPQMLFENSIVGTLSSDSKYVYAIEDLAVPAPMFGTRPGRNSAEKKHSAQEEEKEDRIRSLLEIRVARNALPKGETSILKGRLSILGVGTNNYSPEVQDAIRHNRLQAFSLATNGKLTWELGDPSEKGPLADCYFLGPPLPLAGKLYLLLEKQQNFFLACIDPDARGKVVFMQALARSPQYLEGEPFRRIQAAHLAYSDGILVCPTNAGVLVGVDLLTGNLAWAFPYGDSQSACDEWKATTPIISEGKIVYTPPDAGSLYCLDLKDGSLVWSRKRDKEDLYLGGVVAGIVVIIGRQRVEGVRLANGESLWKLPTGMPSGQGVAAGNVFYLPLREAIHSQEPEICAIDLPRGRIVAHQKTRNKEVPGNLLFFQGQMLSVTPWEIVRYPDLQGKISKSNERLAADANDPVARTECAVLRMNQGNLAGAVEDLRSALKTNPDRDTRRRARSLLFEAWTELFRHDLDEAEKNLKEYEGLCTVDREGAEGKEEERRRREIYFLLLVLLRQSQGWLKDALNAYLDFAALGPREALMPRPESRR